MSTQVISFNDLMSGNRCRSMVVLIVGLGSVSLTELTAKESAKVRSDSKTVPIEDDEANEVFIARTAYRLLSGEYPSDEAQVNAIREQLSSAVLVEVYKQGLAFNLVADDSREVIEKNS